MSSFVKDRFPTGPLDKTRVLYVPVEEVGDEVRLLRACRILISLRAYFCSCAFVLDGLRIQNHTMTVFKIMQELLTP